MQNPTATIVEISTAALYRAAGLTPRIEDEFEELFGRRPDAGDLALGLRRAVDLKRALDALPF